MKGKLLLLLLAVCLTAVCSFPIQAASELPPDPCAGYNNPSKGCYYYFRNDCCIAYPHYPPCPGYCW